MYNYTQTEGDEHCLSISPRKKKKAPAGIRTIALTLYWARPIVLPLRYFGTCWHKMEQNINKLCSSTWPNIYSPQRSMNCWYKNYFLFRFCVWCEAVCLHVMVWILRWIYLRCEPYCLFISRILKKIFLCLTQVWLFLNLRLFNVISHFLPNLFVTGIILDYLHLVSENPRPLPLLEKKSFGRWQTPPPPSETLILPKFSAIYIYDINYNKSFAFTSCS